jgi:Tfp pilus assembly protein PilO
MKTKNLAVGALAALLATALWYNFLLKPTRSQASKVKADTAQERVKLQPLQAQLDQANADAAHAGTFKAQLASLQQAIPDSPAQAAFTRAADAIAAASNVSWQSVTHAPPTPGLTTETINVGVQIKGTYEQVMDYLARLSQLKRLLIVDSVQFSAAGTTGAGAGAATTGAGASTGPFSGANSLTVTIAGRLFEIPPPVVATGGTTTGGTTTAPATGGTPTVTPGSTSTLNNS